MSDPFYKDYDDLREKEEIVRRKLKMLTEECGMVAIKNIMREIETRGMTQQQRMRYAQARGAGGYS